MSGLPGASGAHVEERKVREYLLNLAHPSGGSKARFFRARGFSPEDWRAFARALVLHGQQNAVVYTEMTAF